MPFRVKGGQMKQKTRKSLSQVYFTQMHSSALK
jgi:hypothetical protein